MQQREMEMVKLDPNSIRCEKTWPFGVFAETEEGKGVQYVGMFTEGSYGEKELLGRLNGKGNEVIFNNEVMVLPPYAKAGERLCGRVNADKSIEPDSVVSKEIWEASQTNLQQPKQPEQPDQEKFTDSVVTVWVRNE
jgi:hypothetical protein